MNRSKPAIIGMDLEGVLVPEIWIAVSEKTGIQKLRLTTRDVSDYNQLMLGRIQILNENHLTLDDIQNVIATLDPLPGAEEFLAWVRSKTQIVILSDTFYEFASPLMKKLKYPTLFCNTLEVNEKRFITNYRLRQHDGKRNAVLSFKKLEFFVISVGDSYNDTTMLAEADVGILFTPPANVVAEFPQFPVKYTYEELKAELLQFI